MPVIDHYMKARPSPSQCYRIPCLRRTRLLLRPVRIFASGSLFRDALSAGGISSQCKNRQREYKCSATIEHVSTVLASSRNSTRQEASATTGQRQPKRPKRPSGGDGDPEDGPDDNVSFQIGLDPFSQQLIASALTGAAAWGVAAWSNIDLSSALRLEGESLIIALQLSAPVLLLLLAVLAPRWAPPFKGSELERLRHNYYMTAQVLQLYLNFDDDEEEEEGDGRSDGEGGGSGGERARVRRRLRLEQTVGWGTISSGLALMQAFTLQPWNPPTANAVFGMGLAGRSVQQLANEFLVRGAGWGLMSGWVAGQLLSADASDGILFYGKIFGGPDAVKYTAGLGLVALALPGALWEARAAKNFVRASVVGPVRDAAIFCTGNGVDEPAYCDPAGFAMMAARRPANAASVADVVTRTRAWRSGPESSFSSVSSMGGVDQVELEVRHSSTTAIAAAAMAVDSTTATKAASTAMAAVAIEGSTAAAAAAAEVNPGRDGGADGADAAAAAAAAAHLILEPSPEALSSMSPSEGTPLAPPSAAPPFSGNGKSSTTTSSSSINNSSSSSSSINSNTNVNSNNGKSNNASGADSRSRNSGASTGLESPSARAPAPGPSTAPEGSARAPAPGPSTAPEGSAPLSPLSASVRASSAAFEWDSEDMSVLLRVETLQDKIAFWSSLYYQLLAAFAINGAFLASDGNLLASFGAAWLLRTGPLLLAELRARAAADVAMRG